ncbi:hypothetical protein D3C86_1616090 [compost metagenome]
MGRAVIQIAQHNDTDTMLGPHQLDQNRSGYGQRGSDFEAAEQSGQRSRKTQLPVHGPRLGGVGVHQLNCRKIDTAQTAQHIQGNREKGNVAGDNNPRHLFIPHNPIDNRGKPENRNHL